MEGRQGRQARGSCSWWRRWLCAPDEPDGLEPGDLPGRGGCRLLLLVEVGRDRDDRLGDLLPHGLLGVLEQPGQDLRAHLFRGNSGSRTGEEGHQTVLHPKAQRCRRWSRRGHDARFLLDVGCSVIAAGAVHLLGIEDAAVNGAAEENRGVIFVSRLLDGVGDPGAVLCHLYIPGAMDDGGTLLVHQTGEASGTGGWALGRG